LARGQVHRHATSLLYNTINMITHELLDDFDRYLADRSLTYDGVVIGGAALILLGVISRATEDVDCLDPRIPPPIKAASVEFSRGHGLKEDWFNNGPESLKRDLPEGWGSRLSPLYKGKALDLSTLGRSDLLRSKLFAYCDR